MFHTHDVSPCAFLKLGHGGAASSAGATHQSNSAPDVFTIDTHFAISSRMNFAKSSRLPQAVSIPGAAGRFSPRDVANMRFTMDRKFKLPFSQTGLIAPNRRVVNQARKNGEWVYDRNLADSESGQKRVAI